MAAVGRALVGAFAGFVSTALFAIIATDYFRLDFIENSTYGDRLFNRLIGIGAAIGSGMAVGFGTWQIGGRLGRTLRGTAWGAVARVVIGAILGYTLGSLTGGKGPAAGVTLGMPVGLLFGAAFGGAMAATSWIDLDQEPAPQPVGDVVDRELDG